MLPVKIKANKYGEAIGMLMRMGGGFQTRFENTLIVNATQLRALEEAGFVAERLENYKDPFSLLKRGKGS
jgi:hypothetical protein